MPAGGFANNPISHVPAIGNYENGKTGFLQHPEQTFMHEDEYDEFIAAPYDFIQESCCPE